LGVLRILIEKRLSVDLAAMLQLAAAGLSTKLNSPDAVNDVLDFMMERLRGYYNEQGYRPQLFEAVHALGVTNPLDFDERIKAVKHFSELPEAESLAAANKRISNILKKVEGEQVHPVNPDNLIEPAEKTLYEQIETFSATAQPCFQEGRYTEGLQILAQLKHPVDHFFDSVMVMAEDKQLKSNRIALLTRLRDLFSTVADLSLLPAE
ncbi:MAG TPA: glycine--tRNA ligase subunit beta, partial [Gammaproteobacteria bacterium]|nr:glycine--tRNA ligase subunit beta [Gammaproteobacteria bacterium]